MDKVVHFELTADNLERAKKFYEDVFNWKIEDAQMPGMEYMMVHTTEVDEKMMPKTVGAINGGIMKKGFGVISPVVVINVRDINEAIDKIKKAGGKTVMDTQKVGNMGLYSRFIDSEGNVLGIWQDLGHHVNYENEKMLKLGCKDIGGEGCDFVAEGKTSEEVKKKIFEHAAEAHPDVLAKMSEKDKKKMTALMDKLLKKQK